MRYSIQRFGRKMGGRVFGECCVSRQAVAGLRSSFFFDTFPLTCYPTPISPAINYRLSPQYPFPCAIQDALAAYLYLIRPPAEAEHKPVKPQHIVIMGDSAGGGLTLALLQIIRDSGLPQCAGGVLISPWCDLNHSFPSIHTNTETVSYRPCKLPVKNALILN